MSPLEIRESVLAALHTVAPEADLAALDPRANLREQLDIDSMDFLNFLIRVHDRLKIDIPEADYGQLLTLESCLAYLTRASAARK